MANLENVDLSILAGGGQPVSIRDDLFTDQALDLAPGTTLSLLHAGPEDEAGGDVWKPDPLPYHATHILDVGVDQFQDEDVQSAIARYLSTGETLKVRLAGDQIALTEIQDIIRPAFETPGHLVIEMVEEDG